MWRNTDAPKHLYYAKKQNIQSVLPKKNLGLEITGTNNNCSNDDK